MTHAFLERRFVIIAALCTVALLLVGAGCTADTEEDDTITNTAATTTEVEEVNDNEVEIDTDAEDATGSVVTETVEVTDAVVEDATDDTTATVEEPVAAVQEFTMTASQYDFSPSTITVNEGDTVRITMTSSDVDHGISIPEFGVNMVVDTGATDTVEFVADKAGTYKFTCSVFCGSGHGSMEGTLIVE